MEDSSNQTQTNISVQESANDISQKSANLNEPVDKNTSLMWHIVIFFFIALESVGLAMLIPFLTVFLPGGLFAFLLIAGPWIDRVLIFLLCGVMLLAFSVIALRIIHFHYTKRILFLMIGIIILSWVAIPFIISTFFPITPTKADCNAHSYTLEQALRAPQYVCSLEITGYKGSELAPQIGEFTNLTDMDISDAQITTLPPEIGNLKKLHSLSITNAQLTSIPPEIGELTNLAEMDLSNNRLSSIPSEIGNLVNLDGIELNNNQLTTLPPEIGRLRPITLDVRGNPISKAEVEKIRELLPNTSVDSNYGMCSPVHVTNKFNNGCRPLTP